MHSFRTPTLELASSLRFLATADVGDPISHSWTALPYMAEQCLKNAASLEGQAEMMEMMGLTAEKSGVANVNYIRKCLLSLIGKIP